MFLPRFAMQGMSIGGICFQHGHDVKGGYHRARYWPMSVFPKIQTAIPQRRFQYGDFTVTVLGEIESGDARDYRFVAAFVKEGEAQPRLFVVSEHLPPGERSRGSHALRVINSAMDQVMDVDARWARLQEFTDQALQMGSQMLGLEQETAYPLM